ncbi:hypothetical protein JW758_05565 [Candidatus Peregrinibacteria bacterium]|nr:hypothetical protein [Candidatus Peregrinibacteria bacterium]
MFKKFKKEIIFTVILILIGQIVYATVSKKFTTPVWENRIYATTGVMHDTSDLHKLNEAAHYFGQTMIGWTKFPSFMSSMSDNVDLPEGSSINAHIQERQNIIFTVTTPEPIEMSKIIQVKDYIQKKMDEYNDVNRTKFVLSSLDYEQAEICKTYGFGAMVALIVSLVVAGCSLFIRKEFF